MILRIARFTVDRDDEDAVVELLRSQAGTARRPDGLDDIILALSRSADSSAEFVAVSLWTDMAALMQALGPAWDEPGGISGLAARVRSQSVEHFDVFADDWPEFLDFLSLPRDSRR